MLSNEDYAKAFHEVKNALTIVNSSVQLLEKKHPDILDSEYWQDSKEALDYLKKIVQELSQAKIGSGFPLQPVNLNLLLENVLSSIRSLREYNNCICLDNIASDLPTVQADSLRLTQAIMNLIKNAFESTNMQGTIHLDAYADSNYVYIDITDSGNGIPTEIEPRLFDPFVTSKPNGTGLGLPITKEIVQHLNGILNYDSRPGEGCTFSILLPIS